MDELEPCFADRHCLSKSYATDHGENMALDSLGKHAILGDLKLSFSVILFAVGIATANLFEAPSASASVISSNLNFATVNQNLWGPGDALVVDESVTIPPPAGISATLDPGSFKDPASALASFLGIKVGVTASPTASFDAGLSASFHANSGSIDLNYPKNVQLTIPDQIQAGQSFTVSAALPGPLSPLNLATMPASAFSAVAGAGYSAPGLSPYLAGSLQSLVQPVAGFSTVFPYAEAKVNLDLKASGQITTEACAIFCFDGPTIKLGSVDLSQQIFELSTLNGLKVLDQPVVPFNQTVNVAQGVSIAFKSPNVSLDGVLQPNQSLSDSGGQDFLDFSFNAGQLIPVVGSILQSNIGPVGYDLLSVTPTVSLGVQQSITFDPKLMVDLQFGSPVYDSRDGKLKNDIVFQVGQSVDLMPTVGGLLSGNTIQAKPTFFLDNTIHNTTNLVLNGTLDVQALELDTPFPLGPVFDSGPIDLGSIPLLALDDQSWTLAIPPITGQAQDISRIGLGIAATPNVNFSVFADPSGSTNDQGHPLYDLSAAGNFLAQTFGQLIQVGGPLCGGFIDSDISNCQSVFVSDADVFDPNQNDMGRFFCVVCSDFASLFAPTSPFLTDGSGETLLLSDLTSFPSLITADQLLDPTNPLYDTQLATSQYFREISTTQAAVIPATTPEPGTLYLSLAGILAWSLCGRSKKKGTPDCETQAANFIS